MADEKKERADVKYNRTHTVPLYIRLNVRTDADILEHLEQIDESKMGYVKRLIREDMAKQK